MGFDQIKAVFPGDEIPSNGTRSLGIYNGRATVAGVLCKVSAHSFVLSKTNRYQPYVDDIVIGKVTHVSQDIYKVDLGGLTAALPSLSFANATKRNKPEIDKNDYVLCRVIRKGVEPMLSCTGEGFGKLNGTVLPLDPWKIRMLYLDSTLAKVGKQYRFKIAMGLNGMVWIEAERDVDTRDVYHMLNSIT